MYRYQRAIALLITMVFLIGSLGSMVGSTEGIEKDPITELNTPTRANLHVGSGQTYSTIGDAVEAASDGDTIVIHSGSYGEYVVVDKELTLIGQGGTEPLIIVPSGNAITIRADNVTVQGLEFMGASNAIFSTGSGMTIKDNVFQSPSYGINWNIIIEDLNEDLTMYSSSITGNTFNTPTTSAIYIDHDIDYLMAFPHNVEYGSVEISRNYIFMNTTTAYGIDLENMLDIGGLAGGSIDIDNLIITGNMICGGDYGIRLRRFVTDLYDVQVTADDVDIRDNLLVNQRLYGMKLGSIEAEYWYGNSSGSVGDMSIKDNVLLDQRDYGMRLEVRDIAKFHDNASLDMGVHNISGNRVESVDSGIYLYLYRLGYKMTGDSAINLDTFSIYGNIISSDDEGINFYAQYLGSYLYEASSVTFGSIILLKNEIDGQEGIYLNSFRYLGHSMTGSSTFRFGDLMICHNDITSSGNDGIYVYQIERIGYNNEGTTSVVVGDIMFNDNTIDSSARGFNIHYLRYFGHGLTASASFVIGEVQFLRNSIVSITDGIYIEYLTHWGYYLSGDSTTSIGGLTIGGNDIVSVDNCVELIYCYNIGSYMQGRSQLTMGGIHVKDNDLNSTGNRGIYVNNIFNIGYEIGGDSGVVVGKIDLNYNTIVSNFASIYLNNIYGFGSYTYDDSHFSMDNIEVMGNEITSEGDGIYVNNLEEFGYYTYDRSRLEAGSIVISENRISCEGYGIYVDIGYFGYEMHGSSSMTFDSIIIGDNLIDSTSYSLYIYSISDFGYYMYGDSSFTMNDILVLRNDLVSDSYGIYLNYIEYFGYYMYGSSTFTMGDIRFDENIIVSTGLDYALYVYYIEYFGYYMYVNSSFAMGNMTFNNNRIDANWDGIYVEYIYELGYEMYGTSSFFMENIEFIGNTVHSENSYGIYIYEIYDIGSYLYEDAVATIGDLLITNNEINSSSYGIYIEYIEDIGYEIHGNSKVFMGYVRIDQNEIVSRDSYGLYIYFIGYLGSYLYGASYVEISDISMSDNVISSYYDGIYIEYLYDYSGYYIEGTSEVVIGDFHMDGNIILSDQGSGIYVEHFEDVGYDMHNYATFTMGDVFISNNDIGAEDHGIYLYLSYIGYELKDNSRASIGNILVDENKISSGNEGIYIDDIGHVLSNIDGNSHIDMGYISVSGNEIISGYDGIFLGDIDIGSDLSLKGSGAFGGFRVNDNMINSSEDGIELYFNNPVSGNEFMTSVSLGGVEISRNKIMAVGDGINVTYKRIGEGSVGLAEIRLGGVIINDNVVSCKIGIALNIDLDIGSYVSMDFGDILIKGNSVQGCDQWGISMAYSGMVHDNSTAVFGDQVIENNLISDAGSRGINVEKYIDVTSYATLEMGSTYLIANDLVNNPVGLYLNNTADNYAYLNSFIGNTVDTVSIDVNTSTTWYSPEPVRYRHGGINLIKLIGNYWDDYTGEDTDGDGIGESPYIVVDELDNYPLVVEGSNYYPPIPDLTKPTVTILEPMDGSYLDGDDIEIIWSGDDVGWGLDLFMIQMDGQAWIDKGLSTSHLFPDLPEGPHTFVVKALDLGGNENSDMVSFVIDITPPVVNITGPAEGSWSTGGSIEVHWNTIEEGINTINIRLDEGDWTDIGDVNSTRLQNLTDGEHTITIRAIDLAGNTGNDTVSVYIDNLPPQITVNYPVEGSYLPVNSISVDWTSLDTGAGIAIVELRIGGNDWMNVDPSGIYNLTDLVEGMHNFTLRATDLVGNMIEEMVEFGVDTVDPTLEIASPLAGSVMGETVTVLWTGDGTGSSAVYEIRIDGNNWTDTDDEASHLLSNLSSGEHTVELRITDLAGNFVTRSVAFTVDTTSPSIVSVEPAGSSVPVNFPIRVEFNKVMGENLVITVNGEGVNLTWSGIIATYIPEGGWQVSTTYEVEVSGSDLAGNVLETYEWSFTTSSLSEPQGTIRGRVVDEDGAPIEGARVGLDTGEETFTDEMGEFVLTGPIGTNGVTISRSGYEDEVFKVIITEDGVDLDDIVLKDEKEGSSPWSSICIISVILVIILILIVVVILILRRKKDDIGEWGDEEEEDEEDLDDDLEEDLDDEYEVKVQIEEDDDEFGFGDDLDDEEEFGFGDDME